MEIVPITKTNAYNTLRVSHSLQTIAPYKLMLPIDKEIFFIPFDHIIYAQAEGNYVHVITKDKKYFLSKTLKWISNQLPKNTFLRIHNRYIINPNEMIKLDKSSWQITMSNQVEIPVSRSSKTIFSKWV